MIDSILIANRGEIALRIARAARELGIRTIQAVSEADKESIDAVHSDDAICIGPPHASKSYLDIESILSAAKESKAAAIHPGYGFLAENSNFAEAVEKAGLIFVGPSSKTIRLMGNKVAARKIAEQAGIPPVPGSPERIHDVAIAKLFAKDLGFPVMVKAAAGGGGKGIRMVSGLGNFEKNFSLAQREAAAAFGDSGLFIEKAINNARHIEVQILGDGENVIHLFERDCSIQRKRQKIWEEAPAYGITEEIRKDICQAAVFLAKSIEYKGVGTVEFLLNPKKAEYFFLEMNTRIQVEHAVTEMTTGVDLVREMILIAGGEPLHYEQAQIQMRGHAIEVRINAEDPSNGFFPCPGKISELSIPGGPGVRFDSILYLGYEIPPFYDSLIAKLIVWDQNRDKALIRLRRALGELHIGGIKTTTDLFKSLVNNEHLYSGSFDTTWLEKWLEKDLPLKN